MEQWVEKGIIYGSTVLFCGLVVYFYLRSIKKDSQKTQVKIDKAKTEGRFIPISLHPHIDLSTCIGSGACIKACPEQDILGMLNHQASVINASNCVGHGACFHACPVEAISLRIGTESRGVELPHVNQNYETNVKGIFIAGELGGMGLIKNSVEQGKQAIEFIDKQKPSSKNGVLDLVVIGAGPAGIAATLEAKKRGLNSITLEQDTLGGTVFTFPRSKIVMTSPVELPLHGPVKLYDTSKQELLNLWNQVLGKNDVEIRENTKVDKIVPLEEGHFNVVCSNGEKHATQQVLIAIGRRGTPRKLNIPGENLPKVAYRLLDAEHISGKKIIVVGGGDSAVESAMLLMDQNEVILSYRKDQFARIKDKNAKRIQHAVDNNQLRVVFSSNLTEIKENEVILKLEDEQFETVPNDLVYIFIGGELPIRFLENAGIEIKKRFGYIMKSHKSKN